MLRAGVRLEVGFVMTFVPSVECAATAAVRAPSSSATRLRPRGEVPLTTQDRVEFSAGAQSQEPASDPALRARIAEIRQRIAEGTYLTPDKLDAVVDRLHAEVFKR
jgi:anti-sigma28 factor (negative regulator of flagellin synthesis)